MDPRQNRVLAFTLVGLGGIFLVFGSAGYSGFALYESSSKTTENGRTEESSFSVRLADPAYVVLALAGLGLLATGAFLLVRRPPPSRPPPPRALDQRRAP